MKKITRLALLTLILIVSLTSFTYAQNDDITVYVDNTKVEFDVQPQLIGGRTMVPLRAIFEALGATVEWDESTETVTAYNEAYIVKATINKNIITVNGQEKTIDVAPMLVNSRTLVPARFIAEAFNCQVDWNGVTKRVDIKTPEIDYEKLEQGTTNNNQGNATSNTKTDSDIVLFNEYSFKPTRSVKIQCTNIISGDKANSIINQENRYNKQANSSQQWIILEFNVDYISSTDGDNDMLSASDIIYQDTFFTKEKSSLPVYDMATLGNIYSAYGVFKVKMYPGSSSKIVIGLLTDKNIHDLLLKVPNKNGKNDTWIECHSISSASNAQITESTTTNQISSKKYLGTNIPTYTSVTGVSLKKTYTLENGSPVYTYDYTGSDDIGAYWENLYSKGWKLLSGDDKTTTKTYESSLYKDDKFILIYVYLDTNEVWITFN